MKKQKRILALAGAVLLAGLYIATFVFALIDSPWAYDMFKVCLGFTVVVPVFLYIYMLIYRIQKKNKETENDNHNDL